MLMNLKVLMGKSDIIHIKIIVVNFRYGQTQTPAGQRRRCDLTASGVREREDTQKALYISRALLVVSYVAVLKNLMLIEPKIDFFK